MPTKLILIDGIPGSGKSTTAQFLTLCLQKNHLKAKWFYEAESRHPIYIEFSDCQSTDEFIEKTLEKWQSFAATARESDVITILESSLFQCTVEELLSEDVEREKIKTYAHTVQRIIQGLEPIVIYLYQTDVEVALTKICKERGRDWQDWFVKEIISRPFARNRDLKGFEGLVEFYRANRNLTDELFSEYETPKIDVETSDDDWADSRKKILEFLSLPLVEDEDIPESYLRKFEGTYKAVEGSPRYGTIEHDIRLEEGSLFIYNFWWPKSKLLPKEPDVFYIESSCHELIFEKDSSSEFRKVRVGGSTIGGFQNRVLLKVR